MFIYANNSSYLAQSDILKMSVPPCRHSKQSLSERAARTNRTKEEQLYFIGRVNQKQEPFSGSLSTPISPPSCSTILRQMESPSPVPCTKEFSLTKRSKNLVLHFRLNTYACIGNVETQMSLIKLIIAYPYISFFREFKRIVYKVGNNLM